MLSACTGHAPCRSAAPAGRDGAVRWLRRRWTGRASWPPCCHQVAAPPHTTGRASSRHKVAAPVPPRAQLSCRRIPRADEKRAPCRVGGPTSYGEPMFTGRPGVRPRTYVGFPPTSNRKSVRSSCGMHATGLVSVSGPVLWQKPSPVGERPPSDLGLSAATPATAAGVRVAKSCKRPSISSAGQRPGRCSNWSHRSTTSTEREPCPTPSRPDNFPGGNAELPGRHAAPN